MSSAVKELLLQALDDRDIPNIQKSLAAYADEEQKVKLQIQAREILNRLHNGDKSEQLFAQLRDIVNKKNQITLPNVRFYAIFGKEDIAQKICQVTGMPLIRIDDIVTQCVQRFWGDEIKPLDALSLARYRDACSQHMPGCLIEQALLIQDGCFVLHGLQQAEEATVSHANNGLVVSSYRADFADVICENEASITTFLNSLR